MMKHKNLRNMWDLTAGWNAEFSLVRLELWLQSRRMSQRSTEEPDSTQNLIFPSLTSFHDGVQGTSPSPHSPLFSTILSSSFTIFVGFSSFSSSSLSFAFLLLFLILYLNIPFLFLFLPHCPPLPPSPFLLILFLLFLFSVSDLTERIWSLD